MFIDPGTNSSGWAVFEGDYLLAHGTVIATGSTFERLNSMSSDYFNLALNYQPEYVYFERMNRAVNVACIWFVGAIGVAIMEGWHPAKICAQYADQISPSMWKRYENEYKVFNNLVKDCTSNDEAVAILLGLAYNKYLEGKK
jgi:hypothetical protein